MGGYPPIQAGSESVNLVNSLAGKDDYCSVRPVVSGHGPFVDLRSIPGHCRGVLFAHWARNLQQLMGEAALDTVRHELEKVGAELPDNPRPLDWYPAWMQLRFADVVIEDILGGDITAFETVLERTGKEEARGLFVLRRLGMRRLCRHASKVHSFLYDAGTCDVVESKDEVRLSYSGAPLVFHPTWQRLHHSALRVFARVLGEDVVFVDCDQDDEKAFHLILRQ